MLELGIAVKSRDILGVPTNEEFKHFPDWSGLSLSAEPGKPSVLSFTYPRYGVRANMITSGARIRVRLPISYQGNLLLDSARFKVDPPNMVFVVEDISHPQELGNDQRITVACTSLFDNFKSLLLAPAVGSIFVDEDFLKFDNHTIGQLARETLSIGLSRSPETSLELSFTNTHDSAGVPWGNAIDAQFTPGQGVNEVFEWLTALGFAYPSFGFHKKWIPAQDEDASFPADLLTDYNQAKYQLHLYADPLNGFGYRTYYLSEKYDKSITTQEEFKNIVNSVFVTGNDGICGWVRREDSIQAYGVREGRWTVSNAAQHSTIMQAAERYLDIYAYPRTSQTLSVEFPPDGAILFYFPEVVFSRSTESNFRHSIEMLSLGVDSANQLGTLTITLDNYFDRRKTLLDQRLQRLGLASN